MLSVIFFFRLICCLSSFSSLFSFTPLSSFSKTVLFFVSFYSPHPLPSNLPPSLLLNHLFFLPSSDIPSFPISFHVPFAPLLILSSLFLPLFCFCWCHSPSAQPCHFSMREQTLGRRWLREVTSQRVGPLCSFIRNFQRVSISPSRLQYELFPRYIQHSGATQPVFTCIFIFYFTALFCFRI